jgi:hypothetical protein
LQEVEEFYERSLDGTFLCVLLSDFLADCRRADHVALLFVDNLDQAAYPDRQEEVRQIIDLARLLLTLRGAIVIMTLRREFVSRDLPKYISLPPIGLPGMGEAGLRKVAERRMEGAAAAKRQALKDAGFDTILDFLSGWTDNAWGFLKALAALDYARVDLRGATAKQIRHVLLDEAQKFFPRLTPDEMDRLGAAFQGTPSGLRSRADLERSGVSAELRDRATSEHALIPDWLLDTAPQTFQLAPQLHFLAVPNAG